ncbi:hypothetical protein ACFQ4Q_00420 [Lysobacter gummosus]|uniref:hypothetical protein n=1 Tax=Lysobacter gummosus TaxID=262324 RepID=UPI00362AFD2A
MDADLPQQDAGRAGGGSRCDHDSPIDMPNANDVGIPAFIDKMLLDVYPKGDQARFVLSSF